MNIRHIHVPMTIVKVVVPIPLRQSITVNKCYFQPHTYNIIYKANIGNTQHLSFTCVICHVY